jgi:hypothetical protein
LHYIVVSEQKLFCVKGRSFVQLWQNWEWQPEKNTYHYQLTAYPRCISTHHFTLFQCKLDRTTQYAHWKEWAQLRPCQKHKDRSWWDYRCWWFQNRTYRHSHWQSTGSGFTNVKELFLTQVLNAILNRLRIDS